MHSAFIVQRTGRRRKLGYLVTGIVLVLVCAGVAAGFASSGAGSVTAPPASIGDRLDRPLPSALARATFTDQRSRPVRLSDFAGRVVFLLPFLTSCQEECPVTTGALLAIERALVSDGLQKKVALVEVTVDPARDMPERLAAYAKLTGATWTLLTSTPATITALWRFYGIYYQDVPEASPPGIDWQTGKPYTYDVVHSDGFILLDSHLHERFVAAGMVRNAKLTPTLRRLLDAQGLRNLEHPGGGSWTVNQALQSIGWLLGRPVNSG
jgi:cytochrome oxidase Cu insertion factor (SCO1/SenC/PrrC family)